MRAVLLSAARSIKVVDADEPELGDDDVLIDVRATGICGSDMHAYRGFHPFRRPPVILGHEAAGRVIAVADNVTSVRPGDHVAVEPQIACRRCARCLDGQANLCTNIKRPGQPGAGWGGTFAERIVAPSTVVYPLGPDTSFAEGAMVEPLAVAYRAFRRAEVALGMRVAVLGVGNIGALFAHLCAQAQASQLMVTDVKEYNLRFVESITPCVAVNAATEDVVERGREITGGEGFDVVAIVSGAPSSLLEAVEASPSRRRRCRDRDLPRDHPGRRDADGLSGSRCPRLVHVHPA